MINTFSSPRPPPEAGVIGSNFLILNFNLNGNVNIKLPKKIRAIIDLFDFTGLLRLLLPLELSLLLRFFINFLEPITPAPKGEKIFVTKLNSEKIDAFDFSEQAQYSNYHIHSLPIFIINCLNVIPFCTVASLFEIVKNRQFRISSIFHFFEQFLSVFLPNFFIIGMLCKIIPTPRVFL